MHLGKHPRLPQDRAVSHPNQRVTSPIQLDLNDPDAFTLDGVRNLIASKDDSENRQLRVTKGGMAFLSDQVGATDINGLACRSETWDAGNGYCGPEAAANAAWIERVYQGLKGNWPKPKSSCIDF